MTLGTTGYALPPGAAVEHLDMGPGSRLSLKVTGRESGGSVTLLEGVVADGGPPLHVHDHEDEVVVVLAGELTYRVGDAAGTLAPGGTLWFPRGVPHAVASFGAEPCRFLTVVTPAGIEDFFRAQRDHLASVPPGQQPDPYRLGSVDGAESRRTVGPPLTRPHI